MRDGILIFDGHCDSVLCAVGSSVSEEGSPPRDLLIRSSRGHVDVPRLLSAGVAGQFFALFVDDPYLCQARARAWELLESMERTIQASVGLVRAGESASDALRAKEDGALAAFLAIEGGEAIGDSLHALDEFRSRGVRLMTLTWNRRNLIARGASAPGSDGLSEFGKRVVARMERLGMIVDVSHLADESLDDVLAAAERPVVASHSLSRAVCDHPRNLTDAQAERIARTGGLIGLTLAGLFVDPDPERVSLARFLEHADRLYKVVGADHLGLGTDFDGFSPKLGMALPDCAALPSLAAAFRVRGYPEADIRKIMGQNWLRVLDATMA